MVYITLITFFIFSIIAHIMQLNNKLQYYKRLNYTILGAGILLVNYTSFQSEIEHNLPLPSYLLSILSLSFVIAIIFKRITHIYFAFIPVLASVGFVLIENYKVKFYGYETSENIELLIFGLLGSITPILTHLTKLLVSNLVVKYGKVSWKEEQENQLETIITYAFVGGLALMSSQLLGFLGLIVAATFYLSSTILSEDKLGINNILAFTASGSLFLISTIPFLLNYGNYEVLDLARGEVLAGLLLSGVLIFLHKLFLRFATNSITSWKYLYLIKNILIPIFITLVIGLLYTQKENLGGILSITALILGLALLSPISSFSSNRVNIPVHLGVVATALLILPYIKPVVIKSNSDVSLIQKDKNISIEEQAGEALDIAKGKWTINADKSTLKFSLGPKKSRTEGIFKDIKGTFTVPANINSSEFYVQIPVQSLSTFISARDEHLMEKSYFNLERFSSITFKSSEVEENGDAYIAIGKFKMLGVEKEINVNFKVLGVAEQKGKQILILNVKGSIDRTLFGMSPDEKIGNVVDYDFQVQLEK